MRQADEDSCTEKRPARSRGRRHSEQSRPGQQPIETEGIRRQQKGEKQTGEEGQAAGGPGRLPIPIEPPGRNVREDGQGGRDHKERNLGAPERLSPDSASDRGHDRCHRHPIPVGRMGKPLRVIEEVPQERLLETPPGRQLAAGREVVLGVHVAGRVNQKAGGDKERQRPDIHQKQITARKASGQTHRPIDLKRRSSPPECTSLAA